jgi:hypothetical protein
MIVNRVMPDLPDASELASAKISAALKRKLMQNLADYSALKHREDTSLKMLRDALPAHAALIVAPELGREPRTIADLATIGRSLRPG